MTWEDLLQSIPARLDRDDLSAEFVEEMANEQITLFGPQLFSPSEITDYSITTVAGTFFYPLPAGFQDLTYVRILFGGIWIPVTIARSINDILAVDVVQATPSPPAPVGGGGIISPPVTLCRVYGTQLRVFPTPDGAYPIELTMLATVPGPTSPDDATNFWVNDGNVFLRAATCLAICQEQLDSTMPNSPRIAAWQARADIALTMLQTQVHARTQPSTVRQRL